MPGQQRKTFGSTVRALRESKQIGLRKFAEHIGISPTYLSKLERDQFPPPAEARVVAIAKALDQHPDELLGLAGRVASDLPPIIQRHTKEMASFLRAAKGLTATEIADLAKEVAKRKRRGA